MRGSDNRISALQRGLNWLTRTSDAIRRGSQPIRLGSLASTAVHIPERFRLDEQLGRGGMGAVYRAYDRESGHEVALKLLHGVGPQDRLRLKSEFRALSGIVHPNLVNLYELVIDEQSCFFTMELVRGVDLVTHFRSFLKPNVDIEPRHELRLRDAARQLTLALLTLHDDNKLHRDVKPSNVLVTKGGRVVLLDFGLTMSVTALARGPEDLAGTFPYMAPEQVWGNKLTAAADWYGFGVTLYEAITGELPPGAASRWKMSSSPPSVRAQGYAIGEAIDCIIQRLLASDPSMRPSAEEILACFGGSERGTALGLTSNPPSARLLVGRDAELRQLRALYETTQQGATTLVHVLGTSGIGKSTLIRAFLDEIGQGTGQVRVLRSRCHPQETVAYNAIDGLIDQLAQLLPQVDDASGLSLPADQHQALTRVFPVLAQVIDIAPDAAGNIQPSEREFRRRALVALREVLAWLVRRCHLVIWIDDVQWGDRDSGMVLQELMRLRDQPPLMVILTYREEDRNASACLHVLDRHAEQRKEYTHLLHVGPLNRADSERLVNQWLESDGSEARSTLTHLLDEARGSPFLLCELARYVAGKPTDSGLSDITLDELLRTRMRELQPRGRRLVEVCAVAGAPLDQSVALQAAGLSAAERGQVLDLERLSMLRTTDVVKRRLEVYHDKVREEVLRALSRSEREALHRCIALALLATASPNPLAALEHFEAAGDQESVKRYIVAAAMHASKLLAFERAARLYRRALDLQPEELSTQDLYQRLGVALGNAGRGKEAGQAFLQAAAALDAADSSTPDRLIHLRQKAAEQFIQTGYYDEGMLALYAVFKGLGISLPQSRDRVLRKAAALRLLSALRAPRLPKPRSKPPSELELRRFDALWAAPVRINLTEYALPSYISLRCFREAMKIGDRSRLIRALSLEGAYCSIIPTPLFQKRAVKLLRLVESLDVVHASPNDRAIWLSCRGAVAHYQGAHQLMVEYMDEAISLLRDSSREIFWANNTTWNHWAMMGLQYVGEIRALIRRVKIASDDADAREDRLASPVVLGSGPFVALALDQPDHSLEQTRRSLGWAPKHYTVQHYWHYISTAEAELYRGNPSVAWQASLATWAAHEKSWFLSLNYIRDHLLFTRARAALATAAAFAASPPSAATGGFSARRLLQSANDDARSIERHAHRTGRGWAFSVHAGLASVEGRRAEAVKHLESATGVFERGDVKLYAAACRYCLGELIGGDRGHAMNIEALRWMRSEEIANPDALVRMLVPGVLDPAPRADARGYGSMLHG